MARDFLFRRARFRTILRLRRLAPHRARGRLPTPPPRARRPGVQGTLRGAGGVARRGFARIRCPNCRDPAPHRHDVTPGLVASIQTFGSYAANFHPHVHALVTDDAFTEEGEFLQLPYFDARLVEEVFRRRVLQRLHRAERLSEEFLSSLLGWVHSGFSVHGEQTVPTEDVQGAERLARYLTRGPLPIDVVENVEGGRLRVRTPARSVGSHPRPHHPDPRPRTAHGPLIRLVLEPGPSPSRASWARLLRRIFEVDPLLCPACGSKMKIVSVITEHNVIDAILRPLARTGRRDPFEGRAPRTGDRRRRGCTMLR